MKDLKNTMPNGLRKFKFVLSTETVNQMAELAGLYDLSADELIKKMASDSHAIYIFDATEVKTFLSYMIYTGRIDALLENMDGVDECERNIKRAEEEIAKGMLYVCGGKHAVPWKDIVNSDGSPAYNDIGEFKECQSEYIAQEVDYMLHHKDCIHAYWDEYVKHNPGSYGDIWKELTKIMKWRNEYA